MPQMCNGSVYKGSKTICNRMTQRYAVVGDPMNGLHRKSQTKRAIVRRKNLWRLRNKFGKKWPEVKHLYGY